MPAPEKLKLFAIGNDARGIIAVGTLARGVVAIGINAIGVVAIGINAMGTVLAVGLNALGLVAVSGVNSIAVVAFSLVNAIGGFGRGAVNGVLHAGLGIGLGLGMALISRQLKGEWRGPARPALVRLLDLLAAEQGSGWARAKLLGVEQDKLVVGDADGQHTIAAAPPARAAALEWLASGGSRCRVLVRAAAEPSEAAEAETGYRAAAGRSVMLRALELRQEPRRWRRPESPEELNWVLGRSLLIGAAAGVAGSLGGLVLSLF